MDDCLFEFRYTARKKPPTKIIPVVMEAGMRDNAAWDGILGATCGGLLYVDLSFDEDDERFAAGCELLAQRLRDAVDL